jgi:hypothetical protein
MIDDGQGNRACANPAGLTSLSGHEQACARSLQCLFNLGGTSAAAHAYQNKDTKSCIQYNLRVGGVTKCGDLGFGHFVKPANGGVATITYDVPGTDSSIICEGYTQSCYVATRLDLSVNGANTSVTSFHQVQKPSKLDVFVNGVEGHFYELALAAVGAAAGVRSLGSLRGAGALEASPDLPAYGGGRTSGVLVRPDGSYVPLESGAGPATSLPKPRPGMNGLIVSHVEAHAAAIMRTEDLDTASLYINRFPCYANGNGCLANLSRMVPTGSSLDVFVMPNGISGEFSDWISVTGSG